MKAVEILEEAEYKEMERETRRHEIEFELLRSELVDMGLPVTEIHHHRRDGKAEIEGARVVVYKRPDGSMRAYNEYGWWGEHVEVRSLADIARAMPPKNLREPTQERCKVRRGGFFGRLTDSIKSFFESL